VKAKEPRQTIRPGFPGAPALMARNPFFSQRAPGEATSLGTRVAGAMKFAFAYTGIRAHDLAATVNFFTKGLGMKEVGRSLIEETGGTVVNLASDGKEHQLEVNWYPPGSKFADKYLPGEALDHLYFEMPRGEKLEPAIAHLQRAGGKVRIEPFAEGGGRIAYVDSPDGHTIELYE